jgi:hypothetical protein
VGGEALALGVGEAASGPTNRTIRFGGSTGRARVAAVVEEQAQVGRREEGRGEERVERGRREQVGERRPPALLGRPRDVARPRVGLLAFHGLGGTA